MKKSLHFSNINLKYKDQYGDFRVYEATNYFPFEIFKAYNVAMIEAEIDVLNKEFEAL